MVDISVFKSKSVLNKKAALLLFDNKFYDSSVHCYYYSSLQLSIFTLITKYKLSYDNLKKEAISNKSNSNYYYINKLIMCITDPIISRNYGNTMNSLKALRKQADYEPVKILPTTCISAKDFYIEIEELLNKIK